jgi:uncharacterized protein (DUF488 family)
MKIKSKLLETYLTGVKPADYIKTLEEKKIDLVIDVRSWPKNPPYYDPKRMKDLLEIHGFEYIQFQKLGNPPYLSKKASNHEEAKQIYIKYLKNTKPAKKELAELLKLLQKEQNVCFICYCATKDENKCHRFWLINLLSKFTD